jgi:hypothetical protein
MKALVQRISKALKPLYYQRTGNRLWKVENGFYKLIDFQPGAHGRYFMINICVHPIGLPELQSGRLVIPDRPLEYECILRERVENIVSHPTTDRFRRGSVSRDDPTIIDGIVECLSTQVEAWFSYWAQYETLVQVGEVELSRMLTVVPNLWEKAIAMLKYFCAIRLGRLAEAREQLRRFEAAPDMGYDFSPVLRYLESLQAVDAGKAG